MVEWRQVGFDHGGEHPMRSCRRAVLAGMEEKGRVLEVDLPQVPKQDSARSAPVLAHYKAQR